MSQPVEMSLAERSHIEQIIPWRYNHYSGSILTADSRPFLNLFACFGLSLSWVYASVVRELYRGYMTILSAVKFLL